MVELHLSFAKITMICSSIHWRTFDHEEVLSFCLLKPEFFDVPLLHVEVGLTKGFILHLSLPVFLQSLCLLLLFLHPGGVEVINLLLQGGTSVPAFVFLQLIQFQLVF